MCPIPSSLYKKGKTFNINFIFSSQNSNYRSDKKKIKRFNWKKLEKSKKSLFFFAGRRGIKPNEWLTADEEIKIDVKYHLFRSTLKFLFSSYCSKNNNNNNNNKKNQQQQQQEDTRSKHEVKKNKTSKKKTTPLTNIYGTVATGCLKVALFFRKCLSFLVPIKKMGDTDAAALEKKFRQTLLSIQKGDNYVDCSNQQLDNVKLEVLLEALANAPKPITSINLSGNRISGPGIERLVGFLTTAPRLNELHLSQNQIGDDGAQELFNLYVGEGPIALDIRENPCAEHYVVRLALLGKWGKVNASIKEALMTKAVSSVSFKGVKYVDIDMRLIKYCLLEVEGLKSIDFSDTAAGDNGVWALSQVLKDSTVEEVNFAKVSLSNDGVQHLVESMDLAHHKTLKNLDLSTNSGITNDSIGQWPMKVFNDNTSLISVNLERTSVTPEIKEIIKEECELNLEPKALKDAVVAIRCGVPESREINLQWEKDMSRCMRFLWRYIRPSTVIEVLNLSNSGINDDSIGLLAKALLKNQSLKVLNLANNKITFAGITTLFSLLQKCISNVEEVNVANNDLTDAAAAPIIVAIRQNPKLKIVNIDCNTRMSPQFADEIGGLCFINQSPPTIRKVLPGVEKNNKDITEVDFSSPDEVHNDESVRLLCQAMISNTVVKKLNLSNNVIGDIGACALADLLSVNTTVTDVNLHKNSIGNRGAARLGDVLRTNKTLKHLDLSDNMLDNEGVEAYPDMLRVNHYIREINVDKTRVTADKAEILKIGCEFNRECAYVKVCTYRLQDWDESFVDVNLGAGTCDPELDDVSMVTVCKALKGKTFVRYLDLSGNKFGLDGCQEVANLIADESCTIEKLNLSKNLNITDEAFLPIAQAIAKNKSIKVLQILETSISVPGLEPLIPSLKVNNTLQRIIWPPGLRGRVMEELRRQISMNNESPQVKELINRLENKEKIEEIDLHHLRDRPFGDDACILLCDVLKGNQEIRSLNLARNKITVAGASYLVEAMEECKNLTFLDVSKNDINDQGAELFIQILEIVGHVRTLKVKGNPMCQENQERIAQLLAMNLSSQKLKQLLLKQARGERLDEALDFNGNSTGYKLSDDEVMLIAQLMQDTTDVRALDLGSNDIGDRGCQAIATVLRANHSMEALYLDHNPGIQLEGGEALYYALRINPQLHTLSLEGTTIPEPILEDITSLLHVNQAPLKTRINMRATKVEEVDDNVMFKDTDYYTSKDENIEEEALDRCKKTEEILMLKE
eukprot:gene10962-7607_t